MSGNPSRWRKYAKPGARSRRAKLMLKPVDTPTKPIPAHRRAYVRAGEGEKMGRF